MAVIPDINTAGASAYTINVKSPLMQVLLSGTFNGGTVSFQRQIGASWYTIASYTNSAYDIIETVGSGTYRTNTVHGGSPPVLVASVTFAHGNGGDVSYNV
jgi:hypothetical protein